MAARLPRAEPRARVLDPPEARAFFDEQARALLGMSGEEFLRRWDAGEFADTQDGPEDSAMLQLVMLVPFGRWRLSSKVARVRSAAPTC